MSFASSCLKEEPGTHLITSALRGTQVEMTSLFWFHQLQVQVVISIIQNQHITPFTFQGNHVS
jgi:hypothetical protein